MITFTEAQQITLNAAQELPPESVALEESLNRVLAENIISDIDMPPFAVSAMDGFACRAADLDKPLQVIETVPAGRLPQKKIGPGQCARIMTGAPIPEGTDTIAIFEHTRQNGNTITVLKKPAHSNIRHRAEDIRQGQQILPAGTWLRPAEIAVLASAGYHTVQVAKRPLVGVIATGNELIEPAQSPTGAQIRNSNSYQLCAQITQTGCLPHYFGIAGDTPQAIESFLLKAWRQCDVILCSGGVSAGDFDYVPGILKKLHVDIRFAQVRIKPGKPTVFGLRQGKYFFGLPGNPVSTFVLFEVLVKPFLRRLMHQHYQPCMIRAKLKQDIHRKNTSRLEFRPVRLDAEGLAQPIPYHGSGHIHAYVEAQGIMHIPAGVDKITAGSKIEVMLI